MDKNLKNKLKELFSKKGFYIALFLCLCVIVAVGTISYKKLSNKNEVSNSEDINKEITMNVDDNQKTATNEMPNAERAQNDADTSKQSSEKNKTDNSKTQKSTTVATTNNVKFLNPVDGVESRTYTYPKPVKVEDNVFRTIRGVNVEAKIGTDVKAAADGVVDLVENSGVEEGVVVEIKHANGLKTRYGNLDANVSVKQGDKVTSNQVIGKVGNTAKVFSQDVFGQFLNLQVIDANGQQVNPEKYFTLKAK
ncbi:M23 family metallopeptidase [Clostridium saccharobutylicum]|uniref:Metalloendopeptidase-like membrane protein n=1 Tax=Clostridium saccharobutylicum DSM 13864 TaxID=1345695 RepID=U5MLZ7_CLOSA|nr:M23 family metallopeptidase [Clostridium saccharobutylicum]AGX41543.1 metalloendopeptidase-like membrane protein [Clostridium saccharobutylicum DSM 13864]AQR88824.1 stage II sporulation protein Q [Clostridium saccharobutylicum]AQR98723.1 stage II sporulation protein Q [Clostridium saccharobutylicum]AQS08445.1 stage II sporulation protein Q [Clostridium saccharobutylicum]AQS12713.1 stage II sporulation protein Q [Clostridium saccharobutylicum]